MNPKFETVWETLRKTGKLARGHALLDRETGYAVVIEDYDAVKGEYAVRHAISSKAERVHRDALPKRFSGLLPWEVFRGGITLQWRAGNEDMRERDLLTVPAHIWNRWFHVHVAGGVPATIPSHNPMALDRRIELSSWCWRNPVHRELKDRYSLFHS